MTDITAVDPEWTLRFREHVRDLPTTLRGTPSHEEAAFRMRNLVKSRLLRHTDVRDAPERFLAAHRVLAELSTQLGPGFWIRFTVHYNLFAGTVTALGGPGKPCRGPALSC